MDMSILRELTSDQLKSDIPEFGPGDTLRIHVRVIEGEKERAFDAAEPNSRVDSETRPRLDRRLRLRIEKTHPRFEPLAFRESRGSKDVRQLSHILDSFD